MTYSVKEAVCYSVLLERFLCERDHIQLINPNLLLIIKHVTCLHIEVMTGERIDLSPCCIPVTQKKKLWHTVTLGNEVVS